MDRQDIAQTRALQALGWLAAQDGLLDAFLNNSGASLEDVRRNAGDPAFLAGVLDFVLMQDDWVLSCAEALSCPPQTLVEDRAVLGGGDQMHWT
ncbi:DUF3572 domain-containing protein [Thioclava sp. A2]|uniref:DUF3572 domain-containing protein n=1 Tax=Thioclava sp. FCG-A2 TaxID=3080562 RepID=UPI0029548023|nr:DUF3572 domain-containing protein [Thioclava sp. A2]MDV7272239.1 DUF3572 domain-containing protein [Thioclava sp. A2]